MTAPSVHPDPAQLPHLIERTWRDIRTAAAFLTRLPVAPPQPEPPAPLAETAEGKGGGSTLEVAAPGPGDLARASGMFPFVGVAIGGAAAIVMLICYRLGLNELTCALIGLAVMAILTGALHEDGLSDFVDGLGGGRTREERLAIMQDSRIGTFATLAIVFSVGMRASLLSQLPSPAHAAGALIAAAAISRAMLPAMMRWLPPARTEGLAFSAGVPDPAQVTVALVLALIVALVCLDFTTAAAAMAGAAVGAGIVAAIAQQKLGGQTGDALGAAQQAAEIVVLVAVAATL